jgi:hypothetical protein
MWAWVFVGRSFFVRAFVSTLPFALLLGCHMVASGCFNRMCFALPSLVRKRRPQFGQGCLSCVASDAL